MLKTYTVSDKIQKSKEVKDFFPVKNLM